MNLIEGLKVSGQKALDYKSTKIVNNKSVPYATTAEVIEQVPPSQRYVGLMVNVNGVCYWWKSNITDGGLIIYDGRPYKEYIAYLSQAGTAAPTVAIVNNTLGAAIVWTRTGIGDYLGTLAGAFTVNKTIIPIPSQSLDIGNRNVFIQSNNVNTVSVLVRAIDTQSYVDLGTSGGVTVEIRVYY